MTTSAPDRPARRGPGRPPDVNGEDTKAEIHRAARHLIATHGYGLTTTRMISDKVGVSPAALHHYFGRKRNIALSVWKATTDAEFTNLHAAVDAAGTFIEKVQAMVVASGESIHRDREATIFISSLREEARRTPELAEIVEDTRLASLVRGIVEHGVDTGAVDPKRAAEVRATLSAVLLGVTLLATDLSAHRTDHMIDGCLRLFEGSLFKLSTKVPAKRSKGKC